ncbi:hypothetical protein [Cyanobium sp. HWJ4-Hawea]|uniref:hypothetical protein n=1 Tax=Cyanobium sp. HWJ4-Hawea TaxID=2823713 RepID=UPI0020CE84F5|nr:hypothetical protein [Cyanobium sp. HWJ4-Hawea]
MEASIERKLSVAVSWALARVATHDSLERYEESYALSEEFREWLLCLDDHPELLETTVLMVPNNLEQWLSTSSAQYGMRQREEDGILEI